MHFTKYFFHKDLNELIYLYLIMFKEKCPQCGQGDLIDIKKAILSNVEIRKFSCGHEVRSVITEISSGLRIKSKGPTYEFESRKERGLEHKKVSGKRKKGKGI